MTILEVLARATEAAQVASRAYEAAVASADAAEVARRQLERSQSLMGEAETTQRAARAVVADSYKRMSQQVAAVNYAAETAVRVATDLCNARSAVVAEAESAVAQAQQNANAAQARVDVAVRTAEHAMRVRDVVTAASEQADISADYAKSKEATFAADKVIEARNAAARAATDAAVAAATTQQEAALVGQILSHAIDHCGTVKQSCADAEMALGMAQAARAAIHKAVDALNAVEHE